MTKKMLDTNVAATTTANTNKEESIMTNNINVAMKEVQEWEIAVRGLMKLKKAVLVEMLMKQAEEKDEKIAELEAKLAQKVVTKKEEPKKITGADIEATVKVGDIEKVVVLKYANKNKITGMVGNASYVWDRKYNLPKVWIEGDLAKTKKAMAKRALVVEFIKKAIAESKTPDKVAPVTVKKQAVVEEPIGNESIDLDPAVLEQLYA